MSRYKPLSDEQIEVLQSHGCTASDWSSVTVASGFQPDRVRNTQFDGDVKLAAQAGSVTGASGLEKPAGIVNAYISNCTIGENVRIANVGGHLANYEIGDGACIEDIGILQTNPGATFGNGVEVRALNEAGGREIVLFNELSSQFAFLMCLLRSRPKVIERLNAIAGAEVKNVRSDRGRIGAGARISSIGQMVDVNVGDFALINGAASLVNGTVLSNPDAPTTVGANVVARDFIIAESSQLTDAAIVSKSLIGQGCQIGKQFSADNSVFFANCDGLHGEVCNVFAGPYTVTRHKSTLLIAGLFSFFNAGSGTNQSNHMYKLGPVHEGKLERGCKTGSNAYLMWPCRVGPYSVVLGKHTGRFDTANFPFSLLVAGPDGETHLVPGVKRCAVSTVRDRAKWPARDRRQGAIRRDRIDFDIFSPFTVGRMLQGTVILDELQRTTDRSVDSVVVGGTHVKRESLLKGISHYRSGIELYLLEKLISRIEMFGDQGMSQEDALASPPDAVFSEQWHDIGGQLIPQDRLDRLCARLETGEIADLESFNQELGIAQSAYVDDEWIWVKWAYQRVFDVDLDQADASTVREAAESLLTAKTNFLNHVLNDAAKEFDESTQTGFGLLGTAEDTAASFIAVRGQYDENEFVEQLKDEIAALTERLKRSV